MRSCPPPRPRPVRLRRGWWLGLVGVALLAYPAPCTARAGTERAAFDASFLRKLDALMSALRAKGWDPIIVEETGGWRNACFQRSLSSATTQVAYGFHNVTTRSGQPRSMAADLIDRVQRYKGPRAAAFFVDLGAEANRLGLGWGGDFGGVPGKGWDRNHVQALPVGHAAPKWAA